MITSTEAMAAKVFLDSSYAIALAAPGDQYHEEAKKLAHTLKSDGRLLVTTRAVVLEIGNALSKVRYRQAAVRLLNSLENDPTVEIIPLSEELYLRALTLFQDRVDKNWSITDCMSFVVMQDGTLTDALTTDEHFRQAGFRPLLV